MIHKKREGDLFTIMKKSVSVGKAVKKSLNFKEMLLEEIVNNLNERLTEVIKQQEYSREKEAMFKDESEDINSRIMFFTVFPIIFVDA